MESVSFGRFSEGSLLFHKLIALCDIVVEHFETLVMITCFNGSMGKAVRGKKGVAYEVDPFRLASTTFLSSIAP